MGLLIRNTMSKKARNMCIAFFHLVMKIYKKCINLKIIAILILEFQKINYIKT